LENVTISENFSIGRGGGISCTNSILNFNNVIIKDNISAAGGGEIFNRNSVILGGYKSSNLPTKFAFYQNYPNPFNLSTTIEFNLPTESDVKIEVYNTAGQKVQTLLNKKMQEGSHKVEYNAQNLSSGVYFYKINAGEFQDVKKMILIK